MKRVLEQKRKKPLTIAQANAIVDSQMRNSWYLTKSGVITSLWQKRWELSTGGRRKLRLSKQLNKPISAIKYYNGKATVKDIYKYI